MTWVAWLTSDGLTKRMNLADAVKRYLAIDHMND